jgi:hypothetical protein
VSGCCNSALRFIISRERFFVPRPEPLRAVETCLEGITGAIAAISGGSAFSRSGAKPETPAPPAPKPAPPNPPPPRSPSNGFSISSRTAFVRVMSEKLDSGDVHARKAYLRSVIAYVEVDDDRVRIVGEKATLGAVIAGQQSQPDKVRGFVRKWRARGDSNS